MKVRPLWNLARKGTLAGAGRVAVETTNQLVTASKEGQHLVEFRMDKGKESEKGKQLLWSRGAPMEEELRGRSAALNGARGTPAGRLILRTQAHRPRDRVGCYKPCP